VVETARITLALQMCPEVYQQPLRAMMQAQSDGTKVYGVTLVKPISIQLVPWNKHEVVLCSQHERFDVIDVFGNRLNQALGAEYNHYKTVGPTNPTMIVLRPVVLAKPAKHRGGAEDTQLGFFVKLFGAPTEVGYMCGLKLGVLLAADMKATQCTLAPYQELQCPLRLQTCGANIVLAEPRSTSGAGPLHAAAAFGSASVHGLSDKQPAPPQQDNGSQSPTLGASASYSLGASSGAADLPATHNKIVLMDWRRDNDRDEPRLAKRSKADTMFGMRIEYDSWTCSIARPHAHMQAIKKMTQAEFIAQVVLGGAPRMQPIDAGGMALRQHQGDLWFSLYNFWGQSAVKHLASVLALCLEGHGHGKMNVPVLSQHNGCCGKWDMYATWAAWELRLFPAKWVCARCILCPQHARVATVTISSRNV